MKKIILFKLFYDLLILYITCKKLNLNINKIKDIKKVEELKFIIKKKTNLLKDLLSNKKNIKDNILSNEYNYQNKTYNTFESEINDIYKMQYLNYQILSELIKNIENFNVKIDNIKTLILNNKEEKISDQINKLKNNDAIKDKQSLILDNSKSKHIIKLEKLRLIEP